MIVIVCTTLTSCSLCPYCWAGSGASYAGGAPYAGSTGGSIQHIRQKGHVLSKSYFGTLVPCAGWTYSAVY
jgi:hypothetical protein